MQNEWIVSRSTWCASSGTPYWHQYAMCCPLVEAPPTWRHQGVLQRSRVPATALGRALPGATVTMAGEGASARARGGRRRTGGYPLPRLAKPSRWCVCVGVGGWVGGWGGSDTRLSGFGSAGAGARGGPFTSKTFFDRRYGNHIYGCHLGPCDEILLASIDSRMKRPMHIVIKRPMHIVLIRGTTFHEEF